MSKAPTDNNKPPHNNTGTIFEINFQLGYGTLLVIGGVLMWPSDPHWWAFGAMSIICWLAAGGLVFKSLRQMGQLHVYYKRMRAFQKRGKAPKQARLANKQAQQNGGMQP